MNDLAICKRIAEIEGVDALCDRGVVILSENYNELINTICSGRYSQEQVIKIIDKTAYNPLTDDALCFQLMVKYSVDLTHDFSGLWCASMNPTYSYDASVEDYGVISYDKSPNFAILLAIIEAHKD